MLGLKLGSLLEKSGKIVSLILLGISPQWAKPESVRRVYDQVSKKKIEVIIECIIHIVINIV